MNAKKVVPLVISLGSALLLLVIGMKFLSKPSDTAAKRPQVVVVKTNVDAGNVLGELDVTTADVGSTVATDTFFTSTADVVGRVTTVPLIAGQPVNASALAPKGVGPGLQSVILPGQRAITIDINEISGVAGYIQQGCRVDVVQTLRDPTTQEPITRTIAQDVKVLAVGVRHPADGDGGGRSVTLLVSPDQAGLLELACASGHPRLVLRNGNDLAMQDVRTITLGDLRGEAGKKVDPFAPVKPVLAPVPATTEPTKVAVAPTTRPTEEQWTITVVKGGSEQAVKFTEHRKTDDDSTSVDPGTIGH